jgi:uncharacterized protein (DUF2126 family)
MEIAVSSMLPRYEPYWTADGNPLWNQTVYFAINSSGPWVKAEDAMAAIAAAWQEGYDAAVRDAAKVLGMQR